jgi:hypothetical protein
MLELDEHTATGQPRETTENDVALEPRGRRARVKPGFIRLARKAEARQPEAAALQAQPRGVPAAAENLGMRLAAAG